MEIVLYRGPTCYGMTLPLAFSDLLEVHI